MYDLTVILPVCTRGHFLERLRAFRTTGLLRTTSTRLQLLMLTDEQLPDDLADPQAWMYDVKVFRYSDRRVNHKVCQFFADEAPSLVGNSRWYLRLDDDSVTDVQGMMEILNRECEETDPLYFMADTAGGVDGVIERVIPSSQLMAFPAENLPRKARGSPRVRSIAVHRHLAEASDALCARHGVYQRMR